MKKIIIVFLALSFTIALTAQIQNKSNTSNQPNPDIHKAVMLRNAGMILTLGGVGITVAGWISSLIWAGSFEGESGEGFKTIAPAVVGTAVGIPASIIGIPLWAIGSKRINKAALALKTFNIVPENSMVLGFGITIRF